MADQPKSFSSGFAVPIDQASLFKTPEAGSLLSGRNADALNSNILQYLDPSNPLYSLFVDGSSSSTFNNYITTLVTNIANGTSVNTIMNGSMQIWQRGTSFTSAPTNRMLADRWRYIKANTAAVHDVSRSSDVPGIHPSYTGQRDGTGFRWSMLFTLTTQDASLGASDLVYFRQKIENPENWFKIGKQDVVLTFWVKATKIGVYSVVLGDTATFGDASGQGVNYISEYTIFTSDTWEKKTIYIPAHTGSMPGGSSIELGFALMAGANYQGSVNTWSTQSQKYAGPNQINGCESTTNNLYFYITGIQLEVGAIPTKFYHVDFTTELLSCMRYYEKSFPYAQAPAYGISHTLGRPAIGTQIQAGANAQYPAVSSTFLVPKISAATGSNTILYNPVTSSEPNPRNIQAAANCTGYAFITSSAEALAIAATTPSGGVAGQQLALHWATDVEP